MSKRAKLALWTIISAMFVIAVIWAGNLFDVPQAVAEYFRPITAVGRFLPQACPPTSGAPPADLLRIVEEQRRLYGLSLERVVVCKSARREPLFELRSTNLRGLANDEDGCRPLYKGC